MQHRPDALPPEPLCELPGLVFPDVYLEQLLRPTVAWERVEQRRQERMCWHPYLSQMTAIGYRFVRCMSVMSREQFRV